MSDSTPRLGLPDLPDTPELYADTVSDAFARLDAFTDLYLKGQFVNTPPVAPDDGDAYLIGGSPTGDWSGYDYKIATCRDGVWEKYAPFNGLRAFVASTGAFIVYADGVWTDWTSLISAAEASIASAATCDIGAAGSMCLLITGTTAIASFGTAVCKLRFLRFAGALTLVHDAVSLVLPGAANIVTAAGDTAIFTSDGGGHWRCRCYQRASGLPVSLLNPAITGTLSAAAANFSGAITYGGVTLSNSVTGTGPMVLGAAATLTGATQLSGGASAVPAKFLSTNAGGVFTAWTNTSTDVGYVGSAKNVISAVFNLGDFAVSSSGGDIIINSALSNIDFAVQAVRAARIGSDLSFLVGTTTNGGWTGSAKGEFRTTGASQALSVYHAGTGGNALIIRIDNTTPALTSFYYSTTNVGNITTNGTATAYNTASDARMKTVLAEQGHYRDAIKALWVGDFEWKAGGAKAFGVLAQQAYEVMPHHQGVTRPADEAGQWCASAEPFAHLALWGVKDLYVLIEALAARVAVLEAAHAAG